MGSVLAGPFASEQPQSESPGVQPRQACLVSLIAMAGPWAGSPGTMGGAPGEAGFSMESMGNLSE